MLELIILNKLKCPMKKYYEEDCFLNTTLSNWTKSLNKNAVNDLLLMMIHGYKDQFR